MFEIQKMINMLKSKYDDIDLCFEENENGIFYIYYDKEFYDLNDEFDESVIEFSENIFNGKKINFFITFKENYYELKKDIKKRNYPKRIEHIINTNLENIKEYSPIYNFTNNELITFKTINEIKEVNLNRLFFYDSISSSSTKILTSIITEDQNKSIIRIN